MKIEKGDGDFLVLHYFALYHYYLTLYYYCIIPFYSIYWRDPICFPQDEQPSNQNYLFPLYLLL